MFDFWGEYSTTDICGLVKKMKSKKRILFNIENEQGQLEALIGSPPKTSECFKMLSVGGGFSSLAIIKYIAELETIKEMYVSTFRIGKKHFEVLQDLHEIGKLEKVHFITSGTQKRADSTMEYNGNAYNYFDYINEYCQNNNWDLKVFDNHSKLLLLKTQRNFYVIETSSNLNENPKMEQFSWENDKDLYLWYEDLFKELLKN